MGQQRVLLTTLIHVQHKLNIHLLSQLGHQHLDHVQLSDLHDLIRWVELCDAYLFDARKDRDL